MSRKRLLENKIIVGVLAILCCLLWGSAFPSIKIGYRLFEIGASDVMSQILFAGTRFFMAGVLTVIFGSLIQRKFLYPKKDSLKLVGMLSLFQTILQYFFFYIGLAHSTGVKSSIINGMGTFFAILIASLALKQEKLTGNKILGCIFGVMGVILVSLSGGDLGIGFAINGEGFILISSLSYAFSSVLIKEFSKRENPVTLSGYQFMLGGIVMIVVSLIAGGRLTYSGMTGILLLIYMALISSVAYTLWGVLLKYNSVSSVTIYGFTNPIFGVILSAVLLAEWNTLNYKYVIALILVSLGIYVVNKPTSF